MSDSGRQDRDDDRSRGDAGRASDAPGSAGRTQGLGWGYPAEAPSPARWQVAPGKIALTDMAAGVTVPRWRLAPGKRASTDDMRQSNWIAPPPPFAQPAPQQPVLRRADGGDAAAIDGDAAGLVARADRSPGSPLPERSRRRFERALGADLSGVRVHTAPASQRAAQAVHAQAYTVGQNIHFAPGRYAPSTAAGEHLLAHEVAHTVQQRGAAGSAPQAKMDVSTPADASEVEADAAADAMVKGAAARVTSRTAAVSRRPGSGTASGAHAGDFSGLESAAQGQRHWYHLFALEVDHAKVLQKLRALSPADKQALRARSSHNDLKRLIFTRLNTNECLQVFVIIPGWDLRWRLYWLNVGGKLDSLAPNQWQWMLGYASPRAMTLLRRYPSGYRSFLNHAPLEMIPPWDRLQGLVDGAWHGSPVDVRNTVVNLNPTQKATVRGDHAKMHAIITHCGNANECFRVVTYLDFELKWSVYWLNEVGHLPALKSQQWAQLLAEASHQQYQELVGWADMWRLVQKHCPQDILKTTKKDSDPGNAAKAFDDPAHIDSLFSTLGPAGFLATACKLPPMVDAIYGKIQARGKVVPTVDGLPTGARMGAETKANLRKWFFTPKSTANECRKMFERRFRVHTTGHGTYDHTHNIKNGRKVRNNVSLQPFTKPGLSHMWRVCEALPPAAVENNPQLFNILRDQHNGPGNAYYVGGSGGTGDILMGYHNDAELGQQVGRNQDRVYQAGGTGPGSQRANVTVFNATLRHEIGHAVDAELHISATWTRQEVAGNWIKYGSYAQFVDGIIAAAGGLHYGDEQTNHHYRQAMIDAVTHKRTFSAALTRLGVTPPTGDPGGAVSAVWTPDRYSAPSGGNGPWYSHRWHPQGGRNFQDAYGNAGSLFSFVAATRAARQVTDYQWRAPGEWFAECYQVYYSEQEAGSNVPVGARLRSRDPAAAQMISQLVDRGYSPQEMRGGGSVARPPGTGNS